MSHNGFIQKETPSSTITFTWTLEDFFTSFPQNQDRFSISSPRFKCLDTEWWFILCPQSKIGNSLHTELFLCKDSRLQSRRISSYRFGIRGRGGRELMMCCAEWEIKGCKAHSEAPPLFKRDNDLYAPGGNLKVFCSFLEEQVLLTTAAKDIAVQTDNVNKYAEGDKFKQPRSFSSTRDIAVQTDYFNKHSEGNKFKQPRPVSSTLESNIPGLSGESDEDGRYSRRKRKLPRGWYKDRYWEKAENSFEFILRELSSSESSDAFRKKGDLYADQKRRHTRDDPEPGTSSAGSVSEVTDGLQRLSLDMKNMFLNQLDSDLTLKVKSSSFRVHRAVLGARSPVFATMLRNNWSKRHSASLEIQHCDAENFNYFLLHLYSGKTEGLSSENIVQLYRTADKYGVEHLKQEYLAFMRSSLSLDTFCSVADLAKQLGDSELIKESTSFFAKNLKAIVVSDAWQTFVTRRPRAANELYLKALQHHGVVE